MITKIQVNGFKSLSQFELKLRSGLNVLVGPNGSGKTNIVQFFEFLSQLISYPIGHAVSTVGGAGAIFKKIGLDDYEKDIVFKIYGSRRIKSSKTLTYEYEAKITTSFENDSILFSSQKIRVRKGTKFWADPDEQHYSRSKWDIEIETTHFDNKNNVVIKAYNSKKLSTRYVHRIGEDTKEIDYKKEVENYVIDANPSIRSIITTLFVISDEGYYSIYTDLIGGETFNVIPSKVKEQEDAASPPGIKKDGSGLATTLYAMKKSKSKESRFYGSSIFIIENRDRTFDIQTLKKIVSYLKLANNSIFDLDVENDPFNNKLIVKIQIKTGDYTSVLPLSAMSDGTIKWLALITAILTSKTIFSIEEPENFLHPWMQAEIANFIREHIKEKKHESFVLMTTHSESLLNHSEPNEILLVDLKNGKSSVRRISNISLLKEEISRSGFGLGHFYFSNSLQNE